MHFKISPPHCRAIWLVEYVCKAMSGCAYRLLMFLFVRLFYFVVVVACLFCFDLIWFDFLTRHFTALPLEWCYMQAPLCLRYRATRLFFSTACLDSHQRKHKNSHRQRVDSPHKGPIMWRALPAMASSYTDTERKPLNGDALGKYMLSINTQINK